MGRRKQNYLPLSEAAQWVQREQIQSRSQYQTWWEMYKPQQLPKAPWRVYSDWNGWPAFLGTENEFKNAKPHQYRSFDAALAYAQASNIAKAAEWYEADHPDDIPVRPEIVYRGEFMGWKSFLGTGKLAAAHKVAAAQQVKDLGVMALVINHGNPANIIHAFVGPGREAVVERCRTNGMRLLKMYKMEEGYDWKAKIGLHGSEYGEDEWIISNVNELMWELGNDLLFVN